MTIAVTATPLPPLPELASIWRSLEARATPSFFLSWTWIGTWLATLEEARYPTAALRLLTASRDGQVVGLAILGIPKWRATLKPQPIFLNQSGDPAQTNIYIEYNDILAETAVAAEVRAACLAFVRTQWPWRRVRIQAGVDGLHAAVKASPHVARTPRADTCSYADLSRAPPGEDALRRFLELLSSNTRQQISRARRRAETAGELTFQRAQTPEHAQAFLDELIALHDLAWRERKQLEGAFTSPLIRRFVERLVHEGLANGTVELLRIAAAGQTVGVLLNFVFRGEAYSYQSGFAYSADNRDKPGLLCHALAAADYIRRGVRAYHFMAGQGRYKGSLSNATEQLTWIEIYPNAALAHAEDAARRCWRKLRDRRLRAEPGGEIGH